ncbi:hypothetical protein WDW37_17820 [Bdellovibrionota bacterium FG-1]
MKNVVYLFVSLVVLVLVSSISPMQVHADESIQQVGANAQQKQALVKFMQTRLIRHASMSWEQLQADIQAAAAHNRDILAKKGGVDLTQLNKAISYAQDELKTLDRDTVLAIERREIQQAMSSGNFLFGLTRNLIPCNSSGNYYDTFCSGERNSSLLIWTVFTIPLDIVALPIEFIISAVSGF